ncbi:MAG: type II secretion system F family protein [Candidatus Omnitrophica bacterium]|nr:type II secretion system F family protein [Candidatus Omnitrophota bacterium]
MSIFVYKARDKFGKLAKGTLEAEDREAAGSKLKAMGYTPISVKVKKGGVWLPNIFARFQTVKFSDLNMFTRQLVTLQRAGLPLLTSLTSIKEQTTSPVLKAALSRTVADIEGGSHLSEALAKHPNVFNELYVNMVKAGEAGGMLDEVLERLAILGEHEENTREKIKTATRYPIMVVIALAIGFLILTIFVIPRFANIFAKFDTALPLPTRVLIWLNYAIINYWWATLIAVTLLVGGFKKFITTNAGRLWWDGMKLKFPVFGPLFIKIAMSRFSRITGTLARSGVPILQVLDLVSRGVGNVVISRTIEMIRDNVNEGKGMSEPMKISGMFPPIVVQMVAAGEQTGKLDELLLHVSDYYDAQTEHTINNLTVLIEPMLILVLGGGVLFMALGIFLPMWNLMQLFRG